MWDKCLTKTKRVTHSYIEEILSLKNSFDSDRSSNKTLLSLSIVQSDWRPENSIGEIMPEDDENVC